MKVVFSDRAFAALMAETAEKIQTETGGLFLGKVNRDTWYIVETIDPGPNSIFEVAYFEYDRKYTEHLINKIANLYDEKLELIGLWHRHPGSFDVFSGTDDGTNTKYAKMRSCGAISALVNIDPDFRLTMYHVAQPCKYSKIKYTVGDHLIPEKYLRLKTPKRYEKIMQDILHPVNSPQNLQASVSLKSFMSKISPQYEKRLFTGEIDRPKENLNEVRDKIIDVVVADITFMVDEVGIKMSVLQNDGFIVLVQDSIDGVEKVFFVYSEKDNRFIFQYRGGNYIYEDGMFERMYKDEMNENGDNDTSDIKHGQIIDIVTPMEDKIIDGVFRFIKHSKKEDE